MLRTRPLLLAVIAAASLALCVARPALATWPHNPSVNVPVVIAAGDQSLPMSAPDGTGGAFITWADARSGNNDIYVQHVLSSGVVDPLWPVNGAVLVNLSGTQYNPRIVSDGAGGAIVTWQDARTGDIDIYAQRVNAAGATQWTSQGVALCTSALPQTVPVIASDGAGGAIVAWDDLRNSNDDIYAQRVNASGTTLWTSQGVLLCTAALNQTVPTIAPDGLGGAIVAWQDTRSGTNYDIYAQRVNAAGTPQWAAGGAAACTNGSDQFAPALVGDGVGGAIVTWFDARVDQDVYATHIPADGGTDFSWPTDGKVISNATGFQSYPAILSDGANGAIIAWQDGRVFQNYDIYAQHVQPAGVIDPSWAVNGVALCLAPGNQVSPTIVSDGVGGAIVTWTDGRSGGNNYNNIYAQRVQLNGTVDPVWPTDGRAIGAAVGGQLAPTVVPDGTGGIIAAWQDRRNGNYDIYAQRVARFGVLGTPEAEIAGVKDVPNDNGGQVKLSWNASWLDTGGDPNLSAYDILRSVPPNLAAQRVARGARVVTAPDATIRSEAHPLLATRFHAQTFYWEYLTSVSALHYVSGYSDLAPTAQDSTGAGAPRTAFMVVARNAAGTIYWPSRPDSGYSVDNLVPAAPAPFTGQYGAGTASLHWSPNSEPDLEGYRLYRGTTPGFAPGPGSLVTALTETDYADAAAAPYYYRLSAVATTLLLPTGALDVPGSTSEELRFLPPSPNPAGRTAALQFTLPAPTPVMLAVFDASGRRVRSLLRGVEAAGPHAVSWNLEDDAGHDVGPGLYLVRLELPGRVLVRRLVALR